MSKFLRAFLAIDLPLEVKEGIFRIGQELVDSGVKIRPVAKTAMHLTVKFFGDVTINQVELIKAEMEKSAEIFPPFSLSARGLGAFPGYKNPRVVWVGLGGDTHILENLATDLEKRWRALKFPPEDRPFKGHLTVGRARDRIDPIKMTEALKTFGSHESGAFAVRALTLYRSELLPGGPRYTVLACSNLTGKPNEEKSW
ncbi:MAG: RNA 2',3'-cyclic phosphodiesterase [Deltaproteobacteria bacterium]|nr:RNA 2',3'-cyclic phosphodiesterase [Deltaproteobacteria bacterium]